MNPIRIFISSVQSEFSEERKSLFEYITTDVLLSQYFQPFLFERLPAVDRNASEMYLDEVQKSDIYLGLFGCQYGSEDADGVSPTERDKPIPSYQVYKGDVFQLIDQAVDFVLSKIDLRVGTRDKSIQASIGRRIHYNDLEKGR